MTANTTANQEHKSDFKHAMKFAVPLSAIIILGFELIQVTISLLAAALFSITALYALLVSVAILFVGEMRGWNFVEPVWMVLEP